MIKVSVIIATYNRPYYLAHCLQSVYSQRAAGVDVEACIVNDGGMSIDPIVNMFPHLPIRHLNLPSNVRQVEARNLALGMASGEFIAVCDDDDRWLPTHLGNLLTVFEQERSGAVLAYSDAEIVHLQESADSMEVLERTPFAWSSSERLLQSYNLIVPSSILYPKQLHDTIGLFDTEVMHYWDWDFFLRCAEVGRLRRIPVCDTLYAVFADGSNLSADPQTMNPFLQKLCKKHNLGSLPSSNFSKMTTDPALASFRAETKVEWDGGATIWWDKSLVTKVSRAME